MIPVSLFHCGPSALRSDPDLGPALRAAGVTHLEVDAVEGLPEFVYCVNEGWRVTLIGDNLMRTLPDRDKNCEEWFVKYAAGVSRGSGICDGIEMVDETKQDPAVYMPHAANFVRWWRDAGGPPIAWPGHAPQRWENTELSDYDSRQWNWWTARTWKERKDRLVGSLSRKPTDRQLCCMIDASGFCAEKTTRGWKRIAGWRKPDDGPVGEGIYRQFVEGYEAGARRFRVWALDSPVGVAPDWKGKRVNAKVGDRVMSGIDNNDRRWEYMAKGIKAVKEMAA